MRITVLGCGAAYPRAGGACAGFLVESGDTHVWLDAGNGTFSNLQKYISHRDVDALVLSHVHADHISDTLPFLYALGFDPVRELEEAVDMYAGPDVFHVLTASLGGKSAAIFDEVFVRHRNDEPFTVGPIAIEPFATVHGPPTFGFRISADGKTAVYTADTAWFDALPDHCRDADLLLGEATFLGDEGPAGIHLWAEETGRLAKEADAQRLVIIHIWPSFDPEEAVREAATAYSGPIEAAVEGNTYDL